MRSLLSLFLEVSAAKAEWLAALSAVQAAGIPLAGSQPQRSDAQPVPTTVLTGVGSGEVKAAVTGFDVHVLADLFLRVGHPELAVAAASLPVPYVTLLGSTTEKQQGSLSDVGFFIKAHEEVMQRCFAEPSDREKQRESLVVSGSALTSNWQIALSLVQRGSQVLTHALQKMPEPHREREVVERYKHTAQRCLRSVLPDSNRDAANRFPLDFDWEAHTAPMASAGIPNAVEHPSEGEGKASSRKRSPVASVASTTQHDRTLLEGIKALHDSPKARHTWCNALGLVTQLSAISSDAFCLVLPTLARQGREAEAVQFVRRYLLAPPRQNVPSADRATSVEGEQPSREASRALLCPSPRLLKAVAEAALVMQSEALCALVLSEPTLREALAPSAAVPLVLTLSRLRREDLVLSWWNSLTPANDLVGGEGETAQQLTSSGGKGGSEDAAGTQAASPLHRHLKLCNYVAICYLSSVLRSRPKAGRTSDGEALAGVKVAGGAPSPSHWITALSFLAGAKARDPALATLFSLRLLRMATSWEPALRIVHEELIEPFTAACPEEKQRNGEVDAKGRLRGGFTEIQRAKQEPWLRSAEVAREVHRLFSSENPQQWIPQRHQQSVEKAVSKVLAEGVLTRCHRDSRRPRYYNKRQP